MNIIDSSISWGIDSVLPVHDCFGAHPNNIENLRNIVKREFICLYSNSKFLEVYHQRFIQALNDNNFTVLEDDDGKKYIQPSRKKYFLPELPIIGKLDLQKIIDSQYIIT